jgi:ubiquinone/menaquinone biosynthesis C-methylase UbiE
MSEEHGSVYAPAAFWDNFYHHRHQTHRDLNPEGFWATQWLATLELSTEQRVLDLGCGTGGDSLVLARQGLKVIGMDYSHEAILQAREKAHVTNTLVDFLQANMAEPLPFADQQFDIVMSNVAFHSFPDRLLRSILSEVKRVLCPDGHFLFHVNSLEDMHYRPKTRVREIEQHYFLESDGQTMHFFSEAYCRDLLQSWKLIDLKHIHYPPREQWTDKCVWRGIAQRIDATLAG